MYKIIQKVMAGSVMLTLLCSFTLWETNFETAKQKAKESHKYILLNFSGSDWCGPCRMLKQEFFESDAFKQYADSNLILLNADFPRQKKNQLSKEQQTQNDKLADKFNAGGFFPYTLLLDESGNVVKTWEGLPKKKVADFVDEIKQSIQTDASEK
jgi:thioredoxin-related protein